MTAHATIATVGSLTWSPNTKCDVWDVGTKNGRDVSAAGDRRRRVFTLSSNTKTRIARC